jgi:hypothetical protein
VITLNEWSDEWRNFNRPPRRHQAETKLRQRSRDPLLKSKPIKKLILDNSAQSTSSVSADPSSPTADGIEPPLRPSLAQNNEIPDSSSRLWIQPHDNATATLAFCQDDTELYTLRFKKNRGDNTRPLMALEVCWLLEKCVIKYYLMTALQKMGKISFRKRDAVNYALPPPPTTAWFDGIVALYENLYQRHR